MESTSNEQHGNQSCMKRLRAVLSSLSKIVGDYRGPCFNAKLVRRKDMLKDWGSAQRSSCSESEGPSANAPRWQVFGRLSGSKSKDWTFIGPIFVMVIASPAAVGIKQSPYPQRFCVMTSMTSPISTEMIKKRIEEELAEKAWSQLEIPKILIKSGTVIDIDQDRFRMF